MSFITSRFKRIFNNNFARPVVRFFNQIMDSEDHIVYSHDNITNFITSSGLPTDLAVIEYIKNTKYGPVGDFKKGLEWFNVSEPICFSKHLKGKIVILDFFTYCCINCMHILPDLKEIESDFSVEDGLVVVGVHSAKFINERDSRNILAAVQRYNISHPVVNDITSDMWNKCEVHCWPTLLLLGPHANPLVMLMGEGHKEELKLYIKNALKYYKSRNEISSHSLPMKSAYHLLPELKGPLLFPGKITNFIDSDGNELMAISDTGNNRILIINSEGAIIHQVGGAGAGFKNGNLKNAEFNAPQGLVFQNKDILFVADTENHAIRKIDLKNKTVDTIAGTGVQGHDYKGGNSGSSQLISSPWDLCLYKTEDEKEILIIAMAGTHQIWAYFLHDVLWWKAKQFAGTCAAIVGSGREENRNNQYPRNAAFAQPSGLALCKKNKEVYIADSESSSVRRLSLIDGKVTAVVGGDRNPNNLFAFGDRDGNLYDAKLQHVLGVAISNDENYLYVADTYNHKIKRVDTSKNSISTLQISDVERKKMSFNEPAGLCIRDNNTVLLADTNNHCIKILKVDADNNITDVKILELKLDTTDSYAFNETKYEVISIKPVVFNRKGGKLVLQVKLDCSKELEFTEGAPQKWFVNLPNASWSCVPISGTSTDNIDLVLSIPKVATNYICVDITFNLFTCMITTCHPKNFILRQPIQTSEDGVITSTNAIKINLGVDKIVLN